MFEQNVDSRFSFIFIITHIEKKDGTNNSTHNYLGIQFLLVFGVGGGGGGVEGRASGQRGLAGQGRMVG